MIKLDSGSCNNIKYLLSDLIYIANVITLKFIFQFPGTIQMSFVFIWMILDSLLLFYKSISLVTSG